MCLLTLGTAWAQINADFTSDTTSGCSPVTVQFSDNSSGGSPSSYYWTFGNGNTSTLQNPKAIYYKAGFYDVSLTVTDASGATSTKTETRYIQVFKEPEADFTVREDKGCVPHNAAFSDASTKGDGAIQEWIWDFGNGNTSKFQNPFHQYKFSGSYNVSLVITDANGCESKKHRFDYITVHPKPTPEISADKTFDCKLPLKVQFTNQTKGTNAGTRYLWEFGDGSSSALENPSHEYTKEGSYSVKLTVTTDKGCRVTRTFTNFIAAGDLTPDFEISKMRGCAPLQVVFTDKTTPKASGLTYHWDFGNGKTSQRPSPGIVYDKPGVYYVSLTVSYASKCNSKYSHNIPIRVDQGPDPQIELSDSSVCKVPITIDAKDKSNDAIKWTWYLNGDSVANTKSSKLLIQEFGEHSVELVSENSNGCTHRTSPMKVKAEAFRFTLKAEPEEGCMPLKVEYNWFLPNQEDVIVKQNWDFGTGKGNKEILSESPDNQSFTFTEEGEYLTSVILENSKGCVDTREVKIKVGVKTNPLFDELPDTLCNLEEKTFTNLTQNRDSIDSYQWLMGRDTFAPAAFSSSWDGKLETQNHDSGVYSIYLVTTRNGCSDTFLMEDILHIHPPKADLVAETNPCTSDSIVLRNRSVGEDDFFWRINGKSVVTDSIIRTTKNELQRATLVATNSETKCMDSLDYAVPQIRTLRNEFTITGARCAPSTLVFSSKDQYREMQYLWVIDGDTFTTSSVTFEADKSGTIEAYLWSKDGLTNCETEITEQVTLKGPSITGVFDGTPGCAPRDVKLTFNGDLSKYEDVYWLLDQDTVRVNSVGTISHQLKKPGRRDGIWDIRLVGTDDEGCKGQDDFELFVEGTRNVSIKVGRFESCKGLKYLFSPIFSGIPPLDEDWTYEWDFGDGNTEEAKVYQHEYDKPGVYTVRLKIQGAEGCLTETTYLLDINKENLLAGVGADSTTKTCPPLHVQFEDRSTLNNLRKITEWHWDFGDGTTSRERYPSKVYLESGSFDVKLKVVDEWGCKDSVQLDDFILVEGPVGEYSFDNTSGCVPLSVNFLGDTLRTSSFDWDFGDGTVLGNSLSVNHVYKDTGRFIPLLTLRGPYGCVYTKPPVDTIYVYPNPIADFDFSQTCPKQETQFVNRSQTTPNSSFIWNFSAADTSQGENPTFLFPSTGLFPVTLKVTTEHNCTNEVTKSVHIKEIKANFSPVDEYNCVGNTVYLEDNSFSDTTLTSWKWDVDGMNFTGPTVSFQSNRVGPLRVQLIIEDALSCKDTIETTTNLVIGDTVPPPGVELLRSTVLDDFSNQIDYKRSTASDFASYIIYFAGDSVDQVNDVDQLSYIKNGLNTLHNSYCYRIGVKNACGLYAPWQADEEDCTVEVTAVGDTNKVHLNWNAYAGWDDVERYVIYKEEKENSGNYLPLDSVNGSLSYTDTSIQCNVKHRYKIRAVERNGNNQISWSDTCAALPVYINTVEPNKIVRATVEKDKTVLLEWGVPTNLRAEVDEFIVEKYYEQSGYKRGAVLKSDERDFEDKDVLVDDLSYTYRMKMVDVCKDTSAYSNIGKSILLNADTNSDARPILTFSRYEEWALGVDYYVVQILDPSGDFRTIGQVEADGSLEYSFVDEVTRLNQRPNYCYRVIGYKVWEDSDSSQVVSVSNEDCIKVSSWLYVPNAFTPNRDNLNDVFYTPGWYISEYHIRIYNRWGELLFESYDIYDSWDGTYNGKPCEMEAYLYVIESIGVDRIKRKYKGTVHIVN
jgi:gliding motility-associated-like protein